MLRQRSIVLHQSIILKILFLQCACSECIQKSFLGRSSGPVLVRILQTHQPAVSWTRLGEVAIKSCWIRAHLVCDSIVFVGSTRNPRSRVHHQLTFTVIVIMSPGSNASPARGRGQHCRVHSRSLSTMSSRAPLSETAVASGNICPQQTSATLVAKRQRAIKSSKLSKHGDLAGSAALSET